MSFLLCAGCSRHIKGSEFACPFCGAAIEGAARTGHAALMGSRTRHRLLFGAATAAVAGAAALNGCSAGEATGANDAGSEAAAAQPGYGGPSPYDGAVVVPYGVPDFDSGQHVDSGANSSSDSGDDGG